jgi:hypothetical protein
MGRPIKKKFFGNLYDNQAVNGFSGIGGEGIASVSQPAGGVGSIVISNTYQNFPTLTAAAPTTVGGVTAVLTPVFEIATVTFSTGGQTNADYVQGLSTAITGLGGGAIVYITETASKVTSVDVTTAGTNRGEFRRGDITGVGVTTFQVLQAPNAGTDLQINVTFRVKRIEVTTPGSGYASTPALTWGGHTFTGQTAPSLNVVTLLTANASNDAISFTSYLTTGSSAISGGDIIKQESSRRYLVRNAQGVGRCKLSAGTGVGHVLQPGYMHIIATDFGGATYYVLKLTARKAVLQSRTNTSTALVTLTNDGTAIVGQAKWTVGAATGTMVTIASITV